MKKALSVLVALILVIGFAQACGQKAPQIPAPAAIVVKTDTDYRFAIKRTHDVLDLTADMIIAAKRFEEKLVASPDAPPDVAKVHAAFGKGADDVLAQIKKLALDIDGKSLKTWAEVQARVKPLIDQLNALLKITATPGLSWKDAIFGAINILGPLFLPGMPHIGGVPEPLVQ
jgi:predicted small lipoprotein YifL